MKKIGLFICFLFSFASVSAADISLESKDIVTEGEIFEFSIEINDLPSGSENLNFRIPGIENFDIFAQSRGSSTQIVNGEVSSLSVFTLSLMPQMPGEYELGPVSYELNGETFNDDEIVSIEVQALGARIPVIERDERVTQNKESDETIRPLRGVSFPYIALGFLILGFLVGFYYLLSMASKKSNTEKKYVSAPKPENNLRDYKEKLKEYYMRLSQKKTSLSTSEFYRYYNAGIRELLMDEGYPMAQKSTLSELGSIKNIKSNELYKIISETYYKEFKDDEINSSEQEDYIEKIISYLTK